MLVAENSEEEKEDLILLREAKASESGAPTLSLEQAKQALGL